MQVSRTQALQMQEGRAAAMTPENRLVVIQDLIDRADSIGATPDMKTRWQDEAEKLEMEIQCRKAIEIVAANANQFRYMRQAIAYAYIWAEEQQLDWLDEPTDAELQRIAAEQEANGISEWLNEPPTASAQAAAPLGDLDLGADDRPSTNWREHGYY